MQATPEKLEGSFRERCWEVVSQPIVWLLAGYVLFLLPYAATYLKHHPDERHYTDAGLRMVQTGDYLTPLTPEGELRLKKPILSYWLVAASYRMLGVSPLASRLPFLLVGAAVVWLTYRMATYLYGNRQTGFLAALIVSCQPAILISSPRSVPDIVLTFCLLVSSFGFLRLLREPKADWWSVALAYGGLGLAVEAKGLPAVVFGCFAVSVLLCYLRKQVLESWPRHLAGCLLAVTVGLSWFAMMYWKHGDALLAQFFGDQVAERVNHSFWGVAQDVPLVFLTVACCFIPWWGALAEGVRRRLAETEGVLQLFGPATMLLGGWSVCYLLLASCVSHVNVRYQSVIVPLLSVLAAGLIANLGEERLKIWLRRLSRVCLTMLVTIAMAVVVITFGMGHMTAVALLGALAVCFWADFLRKRLSSLAWPQVGLVSGLTLLAIVPLLYPAARSLVGQSLEERLQAQIESLEGESESIAFFTKPAFSSRLRVITAGQLDGHYMGSDATAIDPAGRLADLQGDVFVLSHRAVEQADLSGMRQYRVATNGFDKMPAGEVFDALWQGDLSDYLNRHRQYLTVAVPHSNAQQAEESVVEVAERSR